MTAATIIGRLLYIIVFAGCFIYLTYGLQYRHNRWAGLLILAAVLLLIYRQRQSSIVFSLLRYAEFSLIYSLWSMAFLQIRKSYAVFLAVFYSVFMGVCFSFVQILLIISGFQGVNLLIGTAGAFRIAAVWVLKRWFIRIDADRRPTFGEAFLGLFPAAACFAANLIIFDFLQAYSTGMTTGYRNLLCFLALFFAFSAGVVLISSEKYFMMNRYKEESERADQQLQEQYRLFLKEQEKNEKIKALYHDMKNHLAVIQNLGATGEAQNYIEDLQRSLDTMTPACITGCPTLDALLVSKKEECERRGIALTSYIHLSCFSFMTPMEIITLFGNCIDNAIEAVSRNAVQDKTIHLSGGEMNDCMVIRITNPYLHELKRKDDSFVTTKDSADYHGYGLKNVRSIIEKYGGTLTFQTEDNCFRVCWLIPIPQNPAEKSG